jgi:hypothetical protein
LPPVDTLNIPPKVTELPAEIMDAPASLVIANTTSQDYSLSPVFDSADQLLLDETKNRFEFEMKSASALHSKSVLFLTLTGIFAAFLTFLAGRFLDGRTHSFFEIIILCILIICLAILIVVAEMLGQSVFTRYQIPALPSEWVNNLYAIRYKYRDKENAEAEILAHLNHNLLKSWIDSVQQCALRNEAKAKDLEQVCHFLNIAITTSFIGMILLLIQAI